MTVESMPIIDCCVYHDWSTQQEIAAYLPQGWQEVFALTASVPFHPRIDVLNPYHSPAGDVLPGSSAAGYPGPVGVTIPASAAVDRGIAAAVLSPGSGKYIGADNNPHFALALCAAVNDWTIDRWLSDPDNRLWGSILVPAQLPEEAAKEIHRVGRHDRMVQVQLSGNGLSKPFGNPIYHPIYEAAAELGLPVAIHADADAPPDTLSQVAALSPPATFTEYKTLSAQAVISHVMSLIAQGVFEKWPTLRVLVIGAGVGWIPWTLWRADGEFHAWARLSPWIKRPPSEYFREFVRVSTYQLDRPPGDLESPVIAAFEHLAEILCYASGYPSTDALDVPDARSALSGDIRANALYRNSLELYHSRLGLDALAV